MCGVSRVQGPCGTHANTVSVCFLSSRSRLFLTLCFHSMDPLLQQIQDIRDAAKLARQTRLQEMVNTWESTIPPLSFLSCIPAVENAFVAKNVERAYGDECTLLLHTIFSAYVGNLLSSTSLENWIDSTWAARPSNDADQDVRRKYENWMEDKRSAAVAEFISEWMKIHPEIKCWKSNSTKHPQTLKFFAKLSSKRQKQ